MGRSLVKNGDQEPLGEDVSIDNFMLEYWARKFADLLAKREPLSLDTFRGLDHALTRTLQRVLECTAGGVLPHVRGSRVGALPKSHTEPPIGHDIVERIQALQVIVPDESTTTLYAVPALFLTPTAVSEPHSATIAPTPLREFLADFGWTSAGTWVKDATLARLGYADVFEARKLGPVDAIDQLFIQLGQSAAPPAFRSKIHLRYLLVAGSKRSNPRVFSETDQASWASLAINSGLFLCGDQAEIVPSGGDPDGFYRSIFHGHITRQAKVIQNFCGPETCASLRIQQGSGGRQVALVEMVTADDRRGLQFLACPAEDPDTFLRRICGALRNTPELLVKRQFQSTSTFYVPVDAN